MVHKPTYKITDKNTKKQILISSNETNWNYKFRIDRVSTRLFGLTENFPFEVILKSFGCHWSLQELGYGHLTTQVTIRYHKSQLVIILG